MSGYVSCACRDCMETAISGDDGPAFCHDCVEAGCPDYQGVEGMSQECQADGAYGGDGDDELDYESPPDGVCPMDGGEGVYLGQLGKLVHFRCRNCGANFSKEST